MTKTRLAIHGAGGRMGKRLIALAEADENLNLVAAVESPHSALLGKDIGEHAGIGTLGKTFTAEVPDLVDAVIDFSVPEASLALAKQCAARGTPLVLATTGFSAEQREELLAISHQTALLMAPNMSLAVNLTMKLASIAAHALKDHPAGVDVEILERHHRMKEDAPSGTALKFGELIAEQMGQQKHQHGREGRPGKRPIDEIGYHAIRTGDNPGEHTIVFGMPGETIELTVRATSRDSYAQGALQAARFLAGKKPGLYSMNDVLGL